MKSFLTRVTVGEFSAEGEGNSKKLSKKRAALSILQELKKLPFIPTVEKPKTHYKKRTKTILKVLQRCLRKRLKDCFLIYYCVSLSSIKCPLLSFFYLFKNLVTFFLKLLILGENFNFKSKIHTFSLIVTFIKIYFYEFYFFL